MRNPIPYLTMRVLGVIDMADDQSIVARIRAVRQTTFTDEDGHPRQFNWRAIHTCYSLPKSKQWQRPYLRLSSHRLCRKPCISCDASHS